MQIDIGVNEEALGEFIEHRKEMKKPMTPLAIKKATKMLLKHDWDHQQYMVDRAILSGWTGLWDVEPPRQMVVSTRDTSIIDDINDTSWAH